MEQAKSIPDVHQSVVPQVEMSCCQLIPDAVVISTLIEKLQYQKSVKDEFPATKRTIGTPSEYALKVQCISSSKKRAHVVGH